MGMLEIVLGGIGGQEEKGTTEDEMAGWHHQLDGREFECPQSLPASESSPMSQLFA